MVRINIRSIRVGMRVCTTAAVGLLLLSGEVFAQKVGDWITPGGTNVPVKVEQIHSVRAG